MSCPSKLRAGGWTIVLLPPLALCLADPHATADIDVRVETWSGQYLDGRWTGLNDGTLRIESADGERRVAVEEVMRLERATEAAPAADADDGLTLFLTDGTRLRGRLTGGGGTHVRADCRWAGRVDLRFQALAAARLTRPEALSAQETAFQSLLADRPADRDVLMASTGDEAQTVRGVLRSLSEQQIEFQWNEQTLVVPVEKAYAVVLARGVVADRPAQAMVSLGDGTRLAGSLLGDGEGRVAVVSEVFGRVGVPLADVTEIVFSTDRIVFAGDLRPAAYRFTPYLNVEWPWRANRSVANGPIKLGGRAYTRGIGMHSQAELDFPCDGAFTTFAATIGIDDAVRPLGCAVFRVLADGREVFNSGPVSSRDVGRRISVPLHRAKIVTLAVDFGPQTDLSDHADWADARFIR